MSSYLSWIEGSPPKKNVIMRQIEFRIFCSAFETGKGDSERRSAAGRVI